MKKIILFLLAFNVFAYKGAIGVKLVKPWNLPFLEGTAKTINAKGDIDYNYSVGVLLDNEIEINNKFLFSLPLEFKVSDLKVSRYEKDSEEDDWKKIYDENKFGIFTLGVRGGYIINKNIVYYLGISYDYLTDKPDELETDKFIVSLNTSIAYQILNYRFEFSLNGLKTFDNVLKIKGYVNSEFTFYLLF